MKPPFDFAKAVEKQHHKLMKKYGGVVSLHEGHSLLREEFEEFWDEVKLKPKNRKPKRIRQELIQLAAVAQIVAESV